MDGLLGLLDTMQLVTRAATILLNMINAKSDAGSYAAIGQIQRQICVQ